MSREPYDPIEEAACPTCSEDLDQDDLDEFNCELEDAEDSEEACTIEHSFMCSKCRRADEAKNPCKACAGRGYVKDARCVSCEGEGEAYVEAGRLLPGKEAR